MGIKSTIKPIDIKSMGESGRNSEINILGKDTLSNFKKPSPKPVDLLK